MVMVLIRSLVFDSLFYITMAVMGIALAPVAMTSRRATTAIIRFYVRLMLATLRVVCNLRTETRGPTPEGDVVIAAKHQSFLDILIIVRALESPRFVMKTELRSAPILGWYAKCLGCIPIDRSAGAAAMEELLDRVQADQHSLGQLVIYPQGTRVAPGSRRPYKSGVAAVCMQTGLPCVPAATNAGVFWGRNSWLRRPGIAVVEFLPPIPDGLAQPEILAEIETRVEAASGRLLAEAQRADDDPSAGRSPAPDPRG